MENKKTIAGWALYDWANSVYSLAITTAIFPGYYHQVSKEISGNSEISFVNFMSFEVSSVSLFSYAVSFSYLIITILSPFLGAVSDAKGNKKSLMLIFSLLGAVSCIFLYLFDKNNFSLGIICFILGSISFAGGNIFNDAMIPEITTHENYSKVSAIGFVAGYLGSVINLIICLYLILNYKIFGFINQTDAVKTSFIIVGVWWLFFSVISFLFIKENKLANKNKGILKLSLKKLNHAFKFSKNNNTVKAFLLSVFFYNMGVQTTLYMSTLYAAQEIKMKSEELIIVILLIQFVAVLGTYIISKIGNKIRYTKTLILGSFSWILLSFYAYIITSPFEFYFLAVGVGFVMGGVQSLSRSAFSLLISEQNDNATFFSFYSIIDKLSIVTGLFIYGQVNSITQNMRLSIFVVILFFVLAFIFTLFFRKVIKNSDNNLLKKYLY